MIGPAQIVQALGGVFRGNKARCRCPVTPHSSDKTPFAVAATRDGRPLVKCWAGCTQDEVITALRAMGLWGATHTTDPSYPAYATIAHDRTSFDADDRAARDEAETIWLGAKPAKGTAVEAYLRTRGIRVPIPDEIRFSPHLRHSQARRRFPAMVARIANDRGFCAVQRTYLDLEKPRKADVSPAKMTRGPMDDGAVRLRMPSSDTLGLAEGIETALSASQLYSMPVWAVCGVHRLSKVKIPKGIRFIHIFGDPGDVGRKYAFASADEYERKGYHVEIYFPAAHFRAAEKADYNDVLQSGAARA